MIKGLTLLQNRFVKYIFDETTKSQTEAARRAGYSKSRANLTACELMKNQKIRKAIEQIEREQSALAKNDNSIAQET